MSIATITRTQQFAHLFAGLLFLIISISTFITITGDSLITIVIAITSFIVIWRFPNSWLLFFPSLALIMQNSPYSGRFLFTEFDILIFTILSALYIKRSLQRSQKRNIKITALIPVVTFVILWSGLNWDVAISDALGPGVVNPYYTSGYGLKVAKSAIYGLLFAWLLSSQWQEHSRLVIKNILLGGIAAALILFVIILWERGIIAAFTSNTSLYQIYSSILDLGGTYRVTGLMADMHTGGESIDGVFVTLLPLTLTSIFYFKNMWLKLLALFATMALFYCVLVGFTRSTYVAIALASTYLVLHFIKNNTKQKLSATLYIYTIFSLLSSMLIFFNTGHFGLLPVAIMLTLPIVLVSFNITSKLSMLIAMMVNTLSLLLMLYFHFNSQWFAPSAVGILIMILSGFTLSISTMRFSKLINTDKRAIIISSHSIATLVVSFVVYLALSGTQMSERFTHIEKDMESRITHWSSVFSSAKWDATTIMVGNSTGSFPLNYIISNPKVTSEVGYFKVQSDLENNSLILGSGRDLKFGQRVHLKPKTEYQIQFLVKSNEESKLNIRYCERHLIRQHLYNSKCVNRTIKLEKNNTFESKKLNFNTEAVGERPWYTRKPTILFFRNLTPGTELELSQISVKSIDEGEELINNGDFSHGLDNWFFYNDFQHLPWHIKNIFIELIYNTGLLGLIMFCTILGQVIILNTKSNDSDKYFYPVNVSLIIGWLALGIFGSPLDSAHSSWLFFTLIFTRIFVSPKNT